jgi:nitrite reductase (NADH) small subunit
VTQAKERKRVTFARAELAPGGRKVVTVGKREILVLDDGGTLRAIYNRCPHRRAAFTAGPLRSMRQETEVGGLEYDTETKVLLCPWHRYEFDLSSGHCVADPERLRVATYDVAIEGDEVAVYV